MANRWLASLASILSNTAANSSETSARWFWIGAIGLVALLAIYRREPVQTEVMFLGAVDDWTWLRTSWWGILGLIGWAYLVAAVLYLLIGWRREWLVAATGLLMLMYVISNHGGFFARVDDKPWLSRESESGICFISDLIGSWLQHARIVANFDFTFPNDEKLPADVTLGEQDIPILVF